MEPSKGTLTIALLFILLLPAGCFTPDYGDGGFLCAEGVCPSGYGCVCSSGKSRCQKGAADSPCITADGGPREGGGDGPPSGPVICSQYKEVSGELMLGVGTFDLALDKVGNPVLVWINNKGEMFAGSPDLKASAWPLKGLLHPKTGNQIVAAAVNASAQLHITFPSQAKSGIGISLWHDYIDLNGAPFTWSGATEIVQTDTVEVSLAGSPTLSSSLYLAATEKVPVSGGASRLVGRLSPGTSGYTYTPVCSHSTALNMTYRAPRVTMGTRQAGGDPHIALSFHEAKTPAWDLATLKVGDNNCPTWYPFTSVKKDSPAPVALDGLGGVQVAWSPAGNSLRGLGKLKWLIWGPSTSITQGSETTVMDNEIVDPRSLSLAIRNHQPCIATWEYLAMPSQTDLRVTCGESPKEWKPSTVIDTMDLTPSQYKGYQTRMMVDAQGKLHLAYMVHKEQTGTPAVSLRYVSCE